MAGKALALFADFVMLTNQNNLMATTESGILQEVQAQTYLTAQLARGKPASKMIKGGRSVVSYSQFTAGTGAAFYQPGDSFTAQIEDADSKIEFPFRFMHDSYAYTDHEIEFNMGGPDSASIPPQIVDILDSKRQFQRTGMYNTVEAAWWTTPSAATMETAATTNRPYSIRAFITEDGLHPSGFTTLGGIASTQTRYRNATSFYTAGQVDTTLMPAFAVMKRKIGFKAPASMAKYLAGTEDADENIFTDRNGAVLYQRLTEQSNDRLVGDGKDLGVYSEDLPYAGILVQYITEIDNIAYSSTQPRYFWVNKKYLYPIWQSNGYFAEKEPMNSVSQYNVWVVHVDLWYQLICTSRQRQGIVCPG